MSPTRGAEWAFRSLDLVSLQIFGQFTNILITLKIFGFLKNIWLTYQYLVSLPIFVFLADIWLPYKYLISLPICDYLTNIRLPYQYMVTLILTYDYLIALYNYFTNKMIIESTWEGPRTSPESTFWYLGEHSCAHSSHCHQTYYWTPSLFSHSFFHWGIHCLWVL